MGVLAHGPRWEVVRREREGRGEEGRRRRRRVGSSPCCRGEVIPGQERAERGCGSREVVSDADPLFAAVVGLSLRCGALVEGRVVDRSRGSAYAASERGEMERKASAELEVRVCRLEDREGRSQPQLEAACSQLQRVCRNEYDPLSAFKAQAFAGASILFRRPANEVSTAFRSHDRDQTHHPATAQSRFHPTVQTE